MTDTHIIQTLSEHLAELRTRFGIRELALFGSVARNEARPNSDVDLIVDYGAPPTFRQYTDALLYLEDLLGCKVDLITRGSLKPELVLTAEQDLLTIQDAA
ncbi:nucleotidyltransferase family protein [soil metagenome]